MNESDALAAFRRMGIVRPSRDLIENWLLAAASAERAAAAELASAQPKGPERDAARATDASQVAPEAAPTPVSQAPKPPRPGKSLLEPLLRQQGAVEDSAGRRRKPGRPRIVAGWFPAVAKTMADGTTLRTALAINGLALSPGEMRSLYRNRTFRALYQEARRRYLLENWGRTGPSLRSVLRRVL